MTPNDYLQRILERQTLEEDGPGLTALRSERGKIEAILRDAFGWEPTIRYGGSKAKGTMILLSYDLDILCYFPFDSDDAGDTLEALYESVATALEERGYAIERKRSAIRVKSSGGVDFHIDVVPGRYFDHTRDDVYLHQNEGNKRRLKTNPVAHVEYVKSSECVPEIRLAKVWRERQSLHVKTFVLELLVIEVLSKIKGSLAERMQVLFETVRDEIDDFLLVDPANTNNDLSPLFDERLRAELADAARRALIAIQAGDWQRVFGDVDASHCATHARSVARAAAAISEPTRPWAEP